MQIVDVNRMGIPAPAQGERPAEPQPVKSSAQGSGEGEAAEKDRVDLSSLTGQISQVLESHANTREDRVQALRVAVQSGTYQVDSQALSRTLVDHALAAGKP
jgi:flagellar biosynthesis anti-sigma factor FlgM